MQKLLKISLIFLISSCGTFKNLKPTDMVYKITEGKPCYYKSIQDLASKTNVKCVEIKETEGWLVIYPEKLKEFLTQGVDELISIKNQGKPK